MHLAELIEKLLKVLAEEGSIKVFDINLAPIENVDVCATEPEAEVDLYGKRYLVIGPKC